MFKNKNPKRKCYQHLKKQIYNLKVKKKVYNIKLNKQVKLHNIDIIWLVRPNQPIRTLIPQIELYTTV